VRHEDLSVIGVCVVTTPIPEVLTYLRSPRRSQPVWELHLAFGGRTRLGLRSLTYLRRRAVDVQELERRNIERGRQIKQPFIQQSAFAEFDVNLQVSRKA